MTTKARIIRFLKAQSLSGKIVMTFIACGLAIFLVVFYALNISYDKLVNTLIKDQLKMTINVAYEDLDYGQWHIANGALYCGDVKVGDGTIDNMYTEPFTNINKNSKSTIYGFLGIRNADGSFTRVAGNTKDHNGNVVVGTKLDDDIAATLNIEDECLCETDIDGTPYLSYYNVLYNAKNERVGYIVAARDVAQLSSQINIFKNIMMLALIAILIFSEVTLILRARSWIDSIKQIKDYLKQMGTGDFPEYDLIIHTDDEIEEVSDSINEMKKSLIHNERIAGELTIATDIQKNMLPRVFPIYPDKDEFQTYAGMKAAREVGGDLYDVFMPDDKHLAIVIADVSGKGVPAALIMAITKIVIKNYASDLLDPAQILTSVNDKLAEDNEEGFFVTAWVGILDLETGLLSYSNAGHNPPAIKLNDNNYKLLKMNHGFVLGGMPHIKYKLEQIQMMPGDSILLYTDGVTESQNNTGEFYGEKRLLEYLDQTDNTNVYQVVDGLMKSLKIFAKEQEQFDDITMLYMIYEGPIRIWDAKLDNFENIQGFLEEHLSKNNVPPKASMEIALALEEIFVNISKYAYSDADNLTCDSSHLGKIYLTINCNKDHTTVTIGDWGIPFNPLDTQTPDITLSAEERQIGGLGIHMVREMMTSLSYKYENHMNILEMTKEY